MTKYVVLLPAITINSANKGLRVTEAAATATGNIVEGEYFLRGDGASGDLLPAVVTAIQAANASVNTYTATIARSANAAAVSGAVTITRATGADTFGVLWADALTTFDEGLIGFPNTNDTVNSSAKVGTLSPSGMWVSPEIYRSFEPGEEYEGAVSRARSGKVRTVRRGGPYETRIWEQQETDSRRLWSYDNTSDPNATLSAWIAAWGNGTRFEFHGVTASSYPTLGALSSSTRIGTYHLDADTMREFRPERMEPGLSLYDFTMRLLEYVA